MQKNKYFKILLQKRKTQRLKRKIKQLKKEKENIINKYSISLDKIIEGIINNIDESILVVNNQLKIISCNDRFLKLINVDFERINNLHFLQIIKDKNVNDNRIEDFFNNISKNKKLIRFEKSIENILNHNSFEAEFIVHNIQLEKYYIFLIIIRNITEKKELAKQIQKKDYFEHVKNKTLLKLIKSKNLYSKTLHESLFEITEKTSELLKIKRVSVWLFNHDNTYVKCIDIFDANTNSHSEGNKIKRNDYPKYFKALLENRFLDVYDAITDERSIEFKESYLQPLNIKSLLDIPIYQDAEIVGMLCCENIDEHRNWTSEEKNFALSIVDLISILIIHHNLKDEISERKEITKALIESENKYKNLNEDLEYRVKQRTEEFKAVNKELEAFVYSISHDLRAPIRHIDGFTNIIKKQFKDEIPEKVESYLEKIIISANNMSNYIDGLLNLSRIGRMNLNKKLNDINKIINEIIKDLEPEIKDRDIEWKISKINDLKCDRILMKIALNNLISNSIKYTQKEKKPIIEINSIKNGLCIKDNGIGFEMDLSDKIFGVFQRLHSQDEFEGLGIGLAIVQRIINKHNGKIQVTSKINEGASFCIELPID